MKKLTLSGTTEQASTWNLPPTFSEPSSVFTRILNLRGPESGWQLPSESSNDMAEKFGQRPLSNRAQHSSSLSKLWGPARQENTILLVEDSPDDKLLTMRAFKKNGLHSKVVMVGDGVEALDYMYGSGPFAGRRLPNLILLDLMLPRLNGFDVLRRMRDDETTQVLPVVVLSSSLLPEDRLQAYRLGANSYIRKPVDFGRFSDVVKLLETYWFELNEGPPIDAE